MEAIVTQREGDQGPGEAGVYRGVAAAACCMLHVHYLISKMMTWPAGFARKTSELLWFPVGIR